MGPDPSIFQPTAFSRLSAPAFRNRMFAPTPEGKVFPGKVLSIDDPASRSRRAALVEAQRLTSAARKSASANRDSGASRLRGQQRLGPRLVPDARSESSGATATASPDPLIDGVFMMAAMGAAVALLFCAL